MSAEFNNNVDLMFSKLENILGTKTVVGEPIYIGDSIVLPLVDIFFGLGSGGFESDEKEKDKSSGGGMGLGAKVTPSAVVVVQNGNVQLVSVKNQDSINKIIDLVPGILSRFNLNGKAGVKQQKPDEAKAPSNVDDLNTL